MSCHRYKGHYTHRATKSDPCVRAVSWVTLPNRRLLEGTGSTASMKLKTMSVAAVLGVLVRLQVVFLVLQWWGNAATALVDQPLSTLGIHKSLVALDSSVSISASPDLLGANGERAQYVDVSYKNPAPSNGDWIGVFSPAKFNASSCGSETAAPTLCTAPIKYAFANFTTPNYNITGEGSLHLRLINQRADYAFALFTGSLTNPVLVAVSNVVAFANPKAPGFVRLAQGFQWNEITVTWSSGYGIDEATPLVRWGLKDGTTSIITGAGTLTYTRDDMCGAPASTVGWRDPGYIHTSYLKELWPNKKYFYQVGHWLENGKYVWGSEGYFKASPFPGQDSLQRVIIFGDMGKAERDGSNEFANYQPGCLNTTDRLLEDLNNYDIVFLIGDLSYSNGYVSQWDQFLEQVEGFTSRVPFMTASGNHERDFPLTGSFYNTSDSGGECGVPAQTLFNMPATNRANYWYKTDFGMFRFCVADSEHDWRPGTEQYAFLEECLRTVDRQKQPWLIFLAHRVLGYSSGFYYAQEGTFSEPWGRDLQTLWQKYKVDLAFYGHIHNYERTCPIYESACTSDERSHYSGKFNGTIHLVVGGGGSHLANFTSINTFWSYVKDLDFGFTKLTAFNHSSLLLEYKRSSDGLVYDQFTITRKFIDVLGCDTAQSFCPVYTLAT